MKLKFHTGSVISSLLMLLWFHALSCVMIWIMRSSPYLDLWKKDSYTVLQCKVVYWSKSKPSRIDPGTDPDCDKCHLGPANLTCFGLVLSLFIYCKSVVDSLSAIISVNIYPSPLVGLFGILPTDHSLPSYFVDLVAFLTFLARHVIALKSWSSLSNPLMNVASQRIPYPSWNERKWTTPFVVLM